MNVFKLKAKSMKYYVILFDDGETLKSITMMGYALARSIFWFYFFSQYGCYNLKKT
jgi:hypothetical protein